MVMGQSLIGLALKAGNDQPFRPARRGAVHAFLWKRRRRRRRGRGVRLTQPKTCFRATVEDRRSREGWVHASALEERRERDRLNMLTL